MTKPVLAEFLAYEADAGVRSELVAALAELATGRRYFTYNAFNVLLDVDAEVVTVEDELDVTRSDTLPLEEFRSLLCGEGST